MKYPINYQNISSNIEFYTEVLKMYQEASEYLLNFNWCKEVVSADLYLNLGSALCIFLFKIENSASINDSYLWLIVGDLPPMYLDIHGPKTIKEVLEDYIRLAEDWIEHVKKRKSIKNCYPFNAEPTIEMATLLEKKTSFMKNAVIDNIDDVQLCKPGFIAGH